MYKHLVVCVCVYLVLWLLCKRRNTKWLIDKLLFWQVVFQRKYQTSSSFACVKCRPCLGFQGSLHSVSFWIEFRVGRYNVWVGNERFHAGLGLAMSYEKKERNARYSVFVNIFHINLEVNFECHIEYSIYFAISNTSTQIVYFNQRHYLFANNLSSKRNTFSIQDTPPSISKFIYKRQRKRERETECVYWSNVKKESLTLPVPLWYSRLHAPQRIKIEQLETLVSSLKFENCVLARGKF